MLSSAGKRYKSTAAGFCRRSMPANVPWQASVGLARRRTVSLNGKPKTKTLPPPQPCCRGSLSKILTAVIFEGCTTGKLVLVSIRHHNPAVMASAPAGCPSQYPRFVPADRACLAPLRSSWGTRALRGGPRVQYEQEALLVRVGSSSPTKPTYRRYLIRLVELYI